MRKMTLTAMGVLSVLVFAPAALADHHRGRHHGEHAHHERVRHERFGSEPQPSRTAQSQPGHDSSSGAQHDTAGTIASFANSTLTITLNDGTVIRATITRDTEIECRMVEDAGDNDNRGDADGIQPRDRGLGGDDDSSGAPGEGDGDGDNGGADPAAGCETASLTPTTVVQEAQLKLSGAGAVWTKVELVH